MNSFILSSEYKSDWTKEKWLKEQFQMKPFEIPNSNLNIRNINCKYSKRKRKVAAGSRLIKRVSRAGPIPNYTDRDFTVLNPKN